MLDDPYIPSRDFAILRETITLLIRAELKNDNNLFLKPATTQALTEELVQKYDLPLQHAQNIVVGLAAEAAMPLIKKLK